jgi:hypothetical protein
MATKTQVVLVDDLTGDPADTTVKFALDKTEYEIDLSNESAAEMREALSRYTKAARKVSGGGGERRGARAPKATSPSSYDPAAVRAWAAGQGIKVSPRGRIKADVVEQFRAAGN